MLIVSASYGAFGMFQLITASFNALNKPIHAAVLSVLRVFVLYVPLAFFGRGYFDLRGIFGAATAANFLSAFAAYILLSSTLKKLK